MAKSIRTMWIWDEEIAECFELWNPHPRKRTSVRLMNGKLCARYFEAIRYRQQLTPGVSFVYRADVIEAVAGLTRRQQVDAKKILEGSGWIETTKTAGGLRFWVTDLARQATGHIRHPIDKDLVRKRLALSR